MLKALRQLFEAAADDSRATPALERRQLQLAVAVLVHEARRADYSEGSEETIAALAALATLFSLPEPESKILLEQGREKAQQLTSFYAPVSVVKREYSMEERITLIEQLWRIAFAEGNLDPYEDHYVRKIAHLLHVPNTQSMVARNRARGS